MRPPIRSTSLLVALSCALMLTLLGCGSEEGSEDDLPVGASPEFIIGHGPLDSTQPGDVVTLQDGATLPIGQGTQGSYMAILCIKTRGALAANIDIEAELRTADDDSLIAFRGSTDQRLMPAEDGYDYYMNFWLISSLWDPQYDGSEAVLRVTATDDRGVSENTEFNVVLRQTSFF